MLRNILLLIACLLLVGVFATSGLANEPGYEITAPKITVLPVIDGVLNDAVWRFVDPVEWGNINTGGEVDKDQFSRSWAAYDDEYIYVAFENLEPDTASLTTNHKVRDIDVWQDDSAELFIEPNNVGSEPYFQIVINAANLTYDDENGGALRAWNPRLESATQIYNDRWTLEVKIPFEDLGFDITPIGETWGWNFNRHIVTSASIWTGWSTTGASFHTPSRFGALTFGTILTSVQSSDKLAGTWGNIKSIR
jgi:hypothetical protein